MCGICGWAGLPPDATHLEAMLATLERRGPDAAGHFAEGEVTLGMRRLAVIDVAGGTQPRCDRTSGTQLVYNGELYNHRELRRELEGRGHRLEGHSDSEVLLHAWLEWGEDALQRLNGMFAFALWEPRQRRLVLARDHLGQKPLHYWQSGGRLVFGSEVRTLLAHPAVPMTLNHSALYDYLRLRHVPGPGTLIDGVRQLPPGSLLRWSPDETPELRRYWAPRFRTDARLGLEEAVEEFQTRWRRAVRRHLISDVPVGAFLSGGIDSGLVAAEAAEAQPGFHTFSIAFDDKDFDETPHALAAARALGCEHEVFRFREPLETLLQEWALAYDQPFSDPAAFPSLILARETRRRVTVTLTGDGGDELFAGYQRYRSTLLGRRLTGVPRGVRVLGAAVLAAGAGLLPAAAASRRWLEAVARRLQLVEPDVAAEYARQFCSWDQAGLEQILGPGPTVAAAELPPGELLPAMLQYDLEHWLPDQMLVKMDRATMAHSLEARLPFLDREIVDFALTLPPDLQWGGGESKRVLREAARRRLPPALAGRPKHGFAVPLDRWLRDDRRSVEMLLEEGLDRRTLPLRATAVRALWHAHRDGHANHGERLLSLLILMIWEQGINRAPDRVELSASIQAK